MEKFYYIIARELGVSKANESIAMVRRMPIEFVGVDEQIALAAARVKAMHSLAYADAFAVATAINRNATIVTVHSDILNSLMFVVF